jgi:hypothetical protein
VDRPLGSPRISRSTWYTRNRPPLGSNADLLRRYGGPLYW